MIEIARENYLGGLRRGYYDALEDAWKMVVGDQHFMAVEDMSDGTTEIRNADENLTIKQARDVADTIEEATRQRTRQQELRAENYVIERGEKHFDAFSDINREKRLKKMMEEEERQWKFFRDWRDGDDDD